MRTTSAFKWLTAIALSGASVVQASTVEDFRREFAQAVYAGSPDLVHDRQPQALLRAVVVLNIKLGEGNRWQADVMRTNSTQPEMLQRALETVERARVNEVPQDIADELRRNGINETWLFDKDGSFQVKTLAKAQRYAGQ
jgi:periplasmic protein TonB